MLRKPANPAAAYEVNRAYGQLTPADYLNRMDPEVWQSLSDRQRVEFERLLREALPKNSPKIVDLRFTIDLLLARFFIVLMVGKDRRRSQRQHPVTPLTRTGNLIAAVMLLLGLNLCLSGAIFFALYLLKSAIGVDFFPGHLMR